MNRRSLRALVRTGTLTALLGGLVTAAGAQTYSPVGSVSGQNTSFSYPTPFGDGYENAKGQYLYLASELTAAGIPSGANISHIQWNVTSVNGATAHERYSVYVGTTATASMPAGFEPEPALQWGPTDYTPVAGANTFALGAPFIWNGTDNILVQICHGATNASSATTWSNNALVDWQTGLAFNGSRSTRDDNNNTLCATTTASGTQTTRPRITIGWSAAVPCAGTPTPGNTTGPASVLAGGTANLGLQNSTSGTGVTYQWYESTDNVTFNPVGPNAPAYSPTVAVDSWFYCDVTCSEPGGGTGSSSVLFVDAIPPPGASCGPYTSSPALAIPISNPLDFLQVQDVIATGPLSGETITDLNVWVQITHTWSGDISLELTSPSATTVNLNFYTDECGSQDNIAVEFDDAASNSYGSVCPLTGIYAIPDEALALFNGEPFEGNWTLTVTDNFVGDGGTLVNWCLIPSLTIPPPCAGVPNPGATTGPGGLVCGDDDVVLGLTNPTPGSGVSYQWYTSPDGVTYSPAGPNSATWITSQSATTWYYCDVTCTEPGGGTGSSTPLQVVQDSYANCLCIPTYTTGKTAGDLISNVEILGTTLANNTGTAPVNPAYTYFNTLPNHTADLQAGTSYTIEVSNGSFSAQNIAVWIDFDDNGVFETPAERIGAGSILGANSSVQFNLSIPCDPLPGVHRMRVRDVWQSPANPLGIDPCNNEGWGETEDYDVTILPPPPCPSPLGFAAGTVTQTSVDLSWTVGCTETAWEVEYGAPGFLPGAGTTVPAPTNPYTLMGLSAGTEYDVWLRADCGIDGLSASVGPVNFTTLFPPPPNDDCANAIPVNCNSITLGYNYGAAADPERLASCGTSNTGSGGVWYTVVGSGGNITASLEGSNFDTKMHVYTGTCGAFVCVDGNDDFAFPADPWSFVTWPSVLGETYTIHIWGFSAEEGDIQLEVACEGNASPSCTDNEVTVNFLTDDWANETSWEIVPFGLSTPVCTGAGSYNDFTEYQETCCLLDGCYVLTFFDVAGDGLCCGFGIGGYRLLNENGDRIIDKWDSGDYDDETLQNFPFCVPIGADRLIFADCDKEDWQPTDFIVASANPAVSAEWGVGDQTDDGYQFWFFDHNTGFNRRMFRSHATSGGYGPPSATRACHLRINTMVTAPIPFDQLLNVRVRSRVNGVYSEFGPACRFIMPSVLPTCPETKLIDDPNSPNFSCGDIATPHPAVFGGSDKVTAYPVVGANKYQFSFRIFAEGFVRNIASNNSSRVLNWVTTPLEDGKTYDVLVRASFDNGATWCDWGDSCKVIITVPPAAASSRMGNDVEGAFSMFPNPNNGEQLYMSLNEIPEDVETVTIDMYDVFGKRVMTRVVPAQFGSFYGAIELENGLSTGMYTVNVTAGTLTWSERLVINK
ncbi:MAG: proprotein convertase P-domain-containing protein [Flavobacteriales bacterium]|nr:proprotein convertase P-domain-containing protein [Flavobacteriales bacterium]